MTIFRSIIAIGISAAALSACTSGERIATRDTPNGRALILSADTRVILFADAPTGYEGVSQMRCAEPQPDVARAIASELSAAVEQPLISLGGTQAASAAVASGYREALGALGERTPTIQLMRDTLYRACEAVMNGVIPSPKEDLKLRGKAKELEKAAPSGSGGAEDKDRNLIATVVTQLDNVMIALHAIDGLTGMTGGGDPGLLVISATPSTSQVTASTGGDGQPSAAVPATGLDAKTMATGTGAGIGDVGAAAIANAVVEVVKYSLTEEEGAGAPRVPLNPVDIKHNGPKS